MARCRLVVGISPARLEMLPRPLSLAVRGVFGVLIELANLLESSSGRDRPDSSHIGSVTESVVAGIPIPLVGILT